MQYVTLYVYADLCSLLTATIQNSVVIGWKMQLTGCHNGNEKRNATCAASKTSKVPTRDALLFISYSMPLAPDKTLNAIVLYLPSLPDTKTDSSKIFYINASRESMLMKHLKLNRAFSS